MRGFLNCRVTYMCVFLLDHDFINYQTCIGLIIIKIFNSLLDKKKKRG